MDKDNRGNKDNSNEIDKLYDSLLFDDEFQKIRAKTLRELPLEKQALLSDAKRRSIAGNQPPKRIGGKIAQDYKKKIEAISDGKPNIFNRMKSLFSTGLSARPFWSGGGFATAGFLLGVFISSALHDPQPTFRGGIPQQSDNAGYDSAPIPEQKLAISKLLENANAGDPFAQNMLGDLYRHGDGLEKDYEKAVQWYTKSAEHGNSSAQYSLGMMYLNGEGVVVNKAEANKWFKQAAKN